MRKLDAIPTDAVYEQEAGKQLDMLPIDAAYDQEVRK